MDHAHPILFVVAAAALAPWLSSHTRSLRVPVAVFEIILGVILGPQVLGWVEFEGGLPYLSTIGMAFLFFLAGVEIDLGKMRGAPLRLASLGWLISLGLAFVVAFALAQVGGSHAWTLVAVALSTMALGIVVPVLRDAELLETELGKFTMAVGALGEIGPIVLMSLLLSREHGVGVQLGLVVAFILVVVGVFWASLRVRPPGLIGLLARTMTKSGQLPIRVSMLLLAALVVLAEEFGLDLALGAFAAGMAVGLAARDSHNEVLHHKFDAVGFGFLVPIFFVCSGLKLDVRALTQSASGLLMLVVYALLLLVVRGLPAWLFRKHLAGKQVQALGFYSATSLSLIVAITGTAVNQGMMASDSAAALVGGGLLSVLIYPVIATRLARIEPSAGAPAPAESVSH
ncbi:MAG TPA: cation:proton antiporter [Polyangiaceae bacterium]|nr:cation:proton antiporter [Polyangiaceae bacterium]